MSDELQAIRRDPTAFVGALADGTGLHSVVMSVSRFLASSRLAGETMGMSVAIRSDDDIEFMNIRRGVPSDLSAFIGVIDIALAGADARLATNQPRLAAASALSRRVSFDVYDGRHVQTVEVDERGRCGRLTAAGEVITLLHLAPDREVLSGSLSAERVTELARQESMFPIQVFDTRDTTTTWFDRRAWCVRCGTRGRVEPLTIEPRSAPFCRRCIRWLEGLLRLEADIDSRLPGFRPVEQGIVSSTTSSVRRLKELLPEDAASAKQWFEFYTDALGLKPRGPPAPANQQGPWSFVVAEIDRVYDLAVSSGVAEAVSDVATSQGASCFEFVDRASNRVFVSSHPRRCSICPRAERTQFAGIQVRICEHCVERAASQLRRLEQKGVAFPGLIPLVVEE